MKYIVAGFLVYVMFFAVSLMNSGSDVKNIKYYYSYPDGIQKLLKNDTIIKKYIPKENSFLSSFFSNFIIFTCVFIILGFILDLKNFKNAFVYFMVVGEGLNIFDLLIIDFLWWTNSKRTKFSRISDEKLYQGMEKHFQEFLRGIGMFACSAFVSAIILNIF